MKTVQLVFSQTYEISVVLEMPDAMTKTECRTLFFEQLNKQRFPFDKRTKRYPSGEVCEEDISVLEMTSDKEQQNDTYSYQEWSIKGN